LYSVLGDIHLSTNDKLTHGFKRNEPHYCVNITYKVSYFHIGEAKSLQQMLCLGLEINGSFIRCQNMGVMYL